MKTILVCLITFYCLVLNGCEDNSTDSETQIINRCGWVDQAGSVSDVNNQYIFERGGDAFSSGFKFNDHVCFKAKVIRDNSNSHGGKTYWCELISMRNA